MEADTVRKTLLAATLTALVSCTTATPGGEKVTLYRYQPAAEFLTTEDRVKSTCRLLKTEIMGEQGGVGTRQEVRNYAATIGADTVLWWEYSESPFAGGSRAEFYSCRQTTR